MIRKLIEWLNQRFPVQLVVTVSEYKELREHLHELQQMQAEMHVKVNALDAQIKRLNDQAGYVSSKKGSFALER